MTALSWPHRRPRPFTRLSRADLAALLTHTETQRDRALGRSRATVDWVAALLESRADALELDAQRQDHPRPGDKACNGGHDGLSADARRAVAHELRDVVREIEEGP